MLNNLIITVLAVSAPILLCAIGSLLCDRAGVTNISLEGTMLISAFAAVAGCYFTENWITGILAGVGAGLAASLFFALITIKFGGAELVVGFTMNVLLDGLSIFLLRTIFDVSGSLVSERIVKIPEFSVPVLKDIPILGGFMTDLNILVCFAYISVFLAYFILKKTQLGLQIISSGENPQAAATVGISVYRIRLLTLVITGVLCGLAGAQLSIGYLSMFTEGMTAGRGFIALVAVMFARGNALRVLLVTMLFGTAEMLSNYLQLYEYSSYLILMIPYICVIALTIIQLMLEKKKQKIKRAVKKAVQ
ncbi:ABC transporter permease [Clostridium sp. Marseille-P3244]|uniref:ABC transporter permease n=1 Tax=Clostridium sp. Marseille-P3244 TaxID=1871020 RepID=UPI00093117C6|nr:ABC transporter permease [Clostridium sp. Marseille-P3244]